MIEIRIPKEIKNYREKLFFGLTLRQCICAGTALLMCAALHIRTQILAAGNGIMACNSDSGSAYDDWIFPV